MAPDSHSGTSPPRGLAERARRRYERGRVRRAAPWALVAIPVLGISLLATPTPGINASIAALLAIALVILHWRGQGWARGIAAGLGVGLVPLVVPTLYRMQGACCGTADVACSADCLTACVGSSVGAGVLLGVHLIRRGSEPNAIVGAALVAGLVGTLGCIAGGLSGVAVLVTVLTGVTVGGLALRPAFAGV
jgi:hypothetical protein